MTHLDQCHDCRDALVRRLIWLLSDRKGESAAGEVASTRRNLGETREWHTGENPSDIEFLLQTPISDCKPVRVMIEDAFSLLAPFSSPPDRCRRCFESGISEVGRLKVERQLGEGGSSIVYLAYDSVLKRQVALKLPRGPLLANPKARERFLREAQAAALLRHPHIVPVYGAGEVAGSFYISLAYCPGPTLAEWLKERQEAEAGTTDSEAKGLEESKSKPPVSARTAAEIIASLAGAVDHAFQSGVLHRDIKPGNILLEPRERNDGDEFPFTPMLSDFGLALLANEQGDLTATGAVVGTPQYMAPEQVTGDHDQLSPATDVHGLGTVLYELLTGYPPVRGRNYAEMLLRVTSTEPALPRTHVSELSRDLEAICLKCLRKSPHDRYQSAAQLMVDLQRFLKGEPTVARPVTRFARVVRWMRRHPGSSALVMLLAVAVTLLIAALGVYNWRLDHLNSELSQSLEQTIVAQRLTEQSELRTQELLYASDMRLAMEAWQDSDLRQYHHLLARHNPGPDNRDLRGWEWNYLWRRGHVESVAFGAHEGLVYFARYSPDGRWIVTAGTDAVVRLYDPQNCQLELELPTGQGEVNGVALSSDYQRMATAGDDGSVRVWELASQTELLRIDAHKNIAYQIAFTGDGRLVSCGNDPTIRIWDAETGEPKGLLQGHTDTVEAIELSPDGQFLASVSMDHTVRLWDLHTNKEARFLYSHSQPAKCVAFSGDGRLVASGAKGGEVVVFDMATYKPVAKLQHLDDVHGVALSSDGNVVAVADGGGMAAIWRIEPNPSIKPSDSAKRVTAWAAHSGRVWSIAFPPNGDRLLTAGSDGKVKLSLPETSFGWRNLALRESGRFDGYPKSRRWLATIPDSAKIVTAVDTRGLLVWELPRPHSVSGKETLNRASRPKDGVSLAEPLVLDDGTWTVSAVSADGQFAAGGNLEGEVAIWNLRTGQRLGSWSLSSSRTIGGVTLSPDGTRIVARHNQKAWLIDTKQPEPLRCFDLEDCRQAVFSPDGSKLAFGDGNVAVLLTLPQLDERLVLKGHTSSVRCIAFSSDGQLVATGSNDRTVNLWDAATGKVVLRLRGHRAKLAEIAFAPDDRSLVAADDAGTLKLWHVASGQELCLLDKVSKGYSGIAFLPYGRGLVCTYGQYEVRLLEWGRAE